MTTITLGRSGLQCEAVGLGTWAMGGWMWGGSDDAAAIAAIRASLDAGVRLIDTAPAYGLGHAERLVGEALKGRREQALIATKCGLVWHTKRGTHFFDEDGQPVYRHLGRDSILYEVDQSLARLQTDYIDLYITHWQDATTPVAETMQALLALKQQGKIRAIGVSNVDAATLLEYLRHGPVDAIQERYSLLDREIETTLRPICADYGIAILGYGSLAMGLLAGPIEAARRFTGDDQRATNARFAPAQRGKFAAFFEELELLRQRHGCSFAQLLVAWAFQAGSASVALCGARNAQQAIQNAGALQVQLQRQDRAAIESAAARHLSGLPSA